MSIRDGRDGGDRVDDSVETRNQILDKPGVDFDSRMDDVDSESEQGEGPDESETGKDGGGEKSGFWDKMKDFFGRKKECNESEEQPESDDPDKQKTESQEGGQPSFRDRMKEGAPSMEQQAETAKGLPGRDEYLENRAKSERADQQNPNRQSWELSPEQAADVKGYQKEGMDSESADADKKSGDAPQSEDRTPGGDAYDRRFGNIEGTD